MPLDPNARARYHEADPHLIERMRALGMLNGCGSGVTAGLVPDFMWAEDCDEHDFDYTVGGTENDRLDAEWRFSMRMILRSNETFSWWNPMRFLARVTAWSYYRTVRRVGGYVSWEERPRGLTMDELRQLVIDREWAQRA